MTTHDTHRDAPASAEWRAPLPPFAHRARMVVAVEVVPLVLAIGGVCVVGVSAHGVASLVVMYVLTMLGVEMGMHRLVAHRQFQAPPGLRAVLCVLGAMAGEGSPLLWSAIHRLHHRDPDGDDDVHSPVRRFGRAPRTLGERVRWFAWAQCGWYGEVPGIARFRRVLARGGVVDAGEGVVGAAGDVQAAKLVRVVEDWRADRTVLACDLLYPAWIVLGFVAPALVGAVVGALGLLGEASAAHGALTGLVWGGLVRFVAVQKVSFAINTVTHTIGARYVNAKDDSRNNVVMAVLTLGSGWHNNHHAFPGSATLWFAPWHVDPTYALIRGLELAGVVTDVRRIDPKIIEARRVR